MRQVNVSLEGHQVTVIVESGSLGAGIVDIDRAEAAAEAAEIAAQDAQEAAAAAATAVVNRAFTNLSNIGSSFATQNPGVSIKDQGYFLYGNSRPLPPNDDFGFSNFCDRASTFSFYRPMTSIGQFGGDGNDATMVISGISYPITCKTWTATAGQTVFTIACDVQAGVKPTPVVSRVARNTAAVGASSVLAGSTMTVTLDTPATAGDLVQVFGVGFTIGGATGSIGYTLPLYRGTNTQYMPDKTFGPYFTLTYTAIGTQDLFVTNNPNNVLTVTVAGVARTWTVFDATRIQLSSPATSGQAVVIVGQNFTPQVKRDSVSIAGQTDFIAYPSSGVTNAYVNGVTRTFTIVDAATIRLSSPTTAGQIVSIRGLGLKSDDGQTPALAVASVANYLDPYGKFQYPNALPLTVNPGYDPDYATNRVKYTQGGWTQNTLKSPLFVNFSQRRTSLYVDDRGDGIGAGLVFTDMVGIQTTGELASGPGAYGRAYGGHFNVALRAGSDGQMVNLEMESSNEAYAPASDIFSYRQKVLLQLVGVNGDVTKAISINHDRGDGGIHTMLYMNEGGILPAIAPEDQEPNLDSGFQNAQSLPYPYNVNGKYVDVGGSFLRYWDIYREAYINGYMVRFNGQCSGRFSAQVVEHALRPNGSLTNIWETNFTNLAGNNITQEYLFSGLFSKTTGVDGQLREWFVDDDNDVDDRSNRLITAAGNYVNLLGTGGDERFQFTRDDDDTWMRFGENGLEYNSLGTRGSDGAVVLTKANDLSADYIMVGLANGVSLGRNFGFTGANWALGMPVGASGAGSAPALFAGGFLRLADDGTLRFQVAGFPEQKVTSVPA